MPGRSTTELVEQLWTGRVKHLTEFLNYAAYRGAIKPATAQSYLTAAVKVMDVVGGDRETDVRNLVVQSWIDAFTEADHGLSPTTLTTYQSRFRRAIDMYRSWLDDPDGVVLPATRQARGGLGPLTPIPAADGPPEFRSVEETLLSALRSTDEDSLVPYRFPAGNGRTAFLLLPYPLTREVSERMSQFVLSLGTDPQDEGT